MFEGVRQQNSDHILCQPTERILANYAQYISGKPIRTEVLRKTQKFNPSIAQDVKGLEMEWVCSWALHNVGAVLDAAGLWLDDGSRKVLVE